MERLISLISLLFFTISSFGIINPIPFKPKGIKKGTSQEVQVVSQGNKYQLTFDYLETISEGRYKATGNVRYESSDMLLTCDILIYEKQDNKIHAEGNVSINFDDFTISGDMLDYDTKEETGTIYNAIGVEKNGNFSVIAKVIRKTKKDWYEVEDGVFTSCNSAIPPWSLKVSRGKFHINNYAFLNNPRFNVRNLPILYSPYIIWPIKPERSTGFLLPTVGSSNTKGLTIGNAFYYAPKDYFDTTFYYDYYKKAGNGIGNEFRYAIRENDYGYFSGYYIKDRLQNQNRWFLTFQNISQIFGFKALVDVNLISDANFFRDFNRDFSQGTKGNFDSTIFLTKKFIGGNLNIYLQRREDFYDVEEKLDQSSLPKIEYRLPTTKIGGGFYAFLETSFSNIYKEFYLGGNTRYSRFDFHPSIEFPIPTPPFIDIIPSLEVRETLYSKGYEGDKISSEPILRRLIVGKFGIKGPRLFRKFDSGLKHIIEPFAEYKWESFHNDTGYPLYDDIDIINKRGNYISYGIRNRFYSRDGSLSVEANLFQEKNFSNPLTFNNGETSKFSPLTFDFKYWPKSLFSLDFRLSYHPLTHSIEERVLSISFSTPKKEQFFRISYFFSNNPTLQSSSFKTRYEELLLAASLKLFDGKMTIEPHIERDLKEKTFRNLRLISWYHGSCYNIGLEGGRREIGIFKDTSFRILISLKQVGNVVDLFGGSESIK